MTNKTPLPGYGIAIIEESQLSNVDYQGDDKFETPQTGSLILLREEDKNKKVTDYSDMTYGELLNKKVHWKKYADADATFYDEELNKNIVFIKLEAIVGHE